MDKCYNLFEVNYWKGTRNMSAKQFGYVRISSKDQNADRQLIELQNLGIGDRDIYIDKQSGKDFNREEYQTMKKCLRQGDVLYIKSIDRFGRNSKEIRKEWEDITQNIKADIVVLDMPLLNTAQYKDMIGDFVSRLVLEVLAFVAEKERDNIKARQAEGIAIAKSKGKYLGRPKVECPDNFEQVYSDWKAGKITGVKAIDKLNLKRSKFYELVREYESR